MAAGMPDEEAKAIARAKILQAVMVSRLNLTQILHPCLRWPFSLLLDRNGDTLTRDRMISEMDALTNLPWMTAIEMAIEVSAIRLL